MTQASTIELPAERRKLDPFSLGTAAVCALLMAIAFAYARFALERGADQAPFVLALAALPEATFLPMAGALARDIGPGRAVWALGRRAGFPPLLERLADRTWSWGMIMALVLAGVVLAFGVTARFVALVALGGVLVTLWGLMFPVARLWLAWCARKLSRRLETTNLSTLDTRAGHVELRLTVDPDHEQVEPPFVEGRWACVRLTLSSDPASDGRTFYFPEKLNVHDESGRAQLDLASCELAGFRFRQGDEMIAPDKPLALMPAFEAATGALWSRNKWLSWRVWAVRPGEPLYVVGDALAVQRGLGAFRGGGSPAVIGSRSAQSALVFIGDEPRLQRELAREVVLQLLVVLLGVGLAFAWLWSARLV